MYSKSVFGRIWFSVIQALKKDVSLSIRRFSLSLTPNYSQHTNRYKIHIIPALNDNYMYLLTDKLHSTGIAIDPVEPEKVMQLINSEKVNLEAVLTTHHHFDHAGGNTAISQMVENLPIYGGDGRIEALTHKLSHEETTKIGDLTIKCLHTPCHTSGHLCYFIKDALSSPVCFTGDTLFVGGCGRFFEGSAADMFKSLELLKALPPNTEVYCGHEYSLNNLKFALSVEPNNRESSRKLKTIEERLSQNKPSVPSTIKEELSYNPFLRTDSITLQSLTKKSDPIEVMAALRKLKDNF